MENIIRNSTDRDKQYMDIDLNAPRKRKNARELFTQELIKYEQEATKNGLPFARHAAREDFESEINKQVNDQLKKYGSIEYPEQIKVPTLNWSQYSDLKNFELIEESERVDDNLSHKNPGLNVSIKVTRYQYKDHAAHKYIVMEDGPSAIKRAVLKRAILDREVSKQLESDSIE